MAAYLLHNRVTALLLSLFIVLCKSCQETGTGLDLNSLAAVQNGGCKHIILSVLGVDEKLPPGTGSGSADPDSTKLSHEKTPKATISSRNSKSEKNLKHEFDIYFPERYLDGQRLAKLARLSREEMSRMPMQFGKRLNQRQKSILTENHDDIEAAATYSSNKNSRKYPSKNGVHNVLQHAEKTLKSLHQDNNKRHMIGIPMRPSHFGYDKEGSELEPAKHRSIILSHNLVGNKTENKRDGYINILQRTLRGRLERMPTGFGKRGAGTRTSRLFHHIESQDSPVYENAMKRLQNKFGIQFLRGVRARLSRMPQLYGRKRRSWNGLRNSDKVETQNNGNDYENSNDNQHLGLHSQKNKRIMQELYKHVPLPDFYEKTSLPSFLLQLQIKLNRRGYLVSNNLAKLKHAVAFVPSHAHDIENGTISQSTTKTENVLTSFKAGKRSSLSRMPLTFGKRSLTSDLSLVPMDTDYAAGSSQEYSVQNQDEENIGSVLKQMKDNRRQEGSESREQTGIETIRRSALSRMPMSYGKRHSILKSGLNARDANEYSMAEGFPEDFKDERQERVGERLLGGNEDSRADSKYHFHSHSPSPVAEEGRADETLLLG